MTTEERKGPPAPMPVRYVQRILARLLVRYGTAYTSRVAGIHEHDLWADWSQVLAGYQHNHAAILFALDNLPPDFPPTSHAFRELCRKAPSRALQALPYNPPPADPAIVAKVSEALPKGCPDARSWATALAEREQRMPAEMTAAQRRMWRIALNLPAHASPADALRGGRAAAA